MEYMEYMEYICFSIAWLILIAAFLCAAKWRKNITVGVRIMGIGIVVANIVLLIPIVEDRSLVLSILGALQTSSLNASFGDFYLSLKKTVGVGRLFSVIYMEFFLTMCITSPMFLGGIILSFFDSVLQKMRFFVLKEFYDVYYFSEVNDKSYLLAKSVRQSVKNRHLIVFCNVRANNELLEDIRKENFTYLPDDEYMAKNYGRKMKYFFEISSDMSKNLVNTKKLIHNLSIKNSSHVVENTKIYLFTDQDEAEIMMNATDKKGLSVTIINEPITVAYNLLYDMPLYKALNKANSKDLSVLVVGAGRVGREIIKAAAWCGQMGEAYKLCIKVVDKEASFVKGIFELEYPELLHGEYDIEFFDADVRTSQFETLLDSDCQNTNYITVSLGNDEQNIKTALFLRRYFLRSSKTFDNEPVICALAGNEIKRSSILELTAVSRERLIKKNWDFSSENAQNYNIYPFGTYESIYSYGFILNSEIEKLAQNVHAVYERAFSGNVKPRDMLYSYQVSEINKRSSRANAVHIRYKLFLLGFYMTPAEVGGEGDAALEKESEKALRELQELLNDNTVIGKMVMLEHQRWNTFQRSEGFRGATREEAEIYRTTTNGSHINLRAKLHACICEWDDLDEIAEAFDPQIMLYDIQLIKSIPAILGAIKDSDLNLSKTSYILAPRGQTVKG